MHPELFSVFGVQLEPLDDIVAQRLAAGFIDGLSIANQLLELATMLQCLLLGLTLF